MLSFHEYAHILCGHVEANLEDHEDKKAEECEAGHVSMDYLINFCFIQKNQLNGVRRLKNYF